MIGNGTMIMIGCYLLESFKLGWTRSINKDGSLDTRRDAFFLCISFCFLKALHLHRTPWHKYTYFWSSLTNATSDLCYNRTSHSARHKVPHNRFFLNCALSIQEICAQHVKYRVGTVRRALSIQEICAQHVKYRVGTIWRVQSIQEMCAQSAAGRLGGRSRCVTNVLVKRARAFIRRKNAENAVKAVDTKITVGESTAVKSERGPLTRLLH